MVMMLRSGGSMNASTISIAGLHSCGHDTARCAKSLDYFNYQTSPCDHYPAQCKYFCLGSGDDEDGDDEDENENLSDGDN